MLTSSCPSPAFVRPLRCLIVDDDPISVRVIAHYLALIPSLRAVGSCTNAADALEFMRQQPVDLLFVDVLMPLVSGIDLLRLLRHRLPKPPYTILITGSAAHAVEAFDYAAVVDYLLKPLAFARFTQAVDRVAQLVAQEAATTRRALMANPTIFFIKGVGHKRTRIDLKEVYYFEASNSYVDAVMEAKRVTIFSSLQELQERLPTSMFAPIHRSFSVNIHLIESIEPDALIIKSERLPISLTYRAPLVKRLHVL